MTGAFVLQNNVGLLLTTSQHYTHIVRYSLRRKSERDTSGMSVQMTVDIDETPKASADCVKRDAKPKTARQINDSSDNTLFNCFFELIN